MISTSRVGMEINSADAMRFCGVFKSQRHLRRLTMRSLFIAIKLIANRKEIISRSHKKFCPIKADALSSSNHHISFHATVCRPASLHGLPDDVHMLYAYLSMLKFNQEGIEFQTRSLPKVIITFTVIALGRFANSELKISF